MDVNSVLKTKKCITIDTNKRIFAIGVQSYGWLNSYKNSYYTQTLQSHSSFLTQTLPTDYTYIEVLAFRLTTAYTDCTLSRKSLLCSDLLALYIHRIYTTRKMTITFWIGYLDQNHNSLIVIRRL